MLQVKVSSLWSQRDSFTVGKSTAVDVCVDAHYMLYTPAKLLYLLDIKVLTSENSTNGNMHLVCWQVAIGISVIEMFTCQLWRCAVARSKNCHMLIDPDALWVWRTQYY